MLFFSMFLKYPKEIWSIAPSSRFLRNKVLKNIDFRNAKYIVEYGPGTGPVTKEILKRARKDARILCFEINKKFCSHLRENIRDERLTIINDSAENIEKCLKKLNIQKIDYIISSLPFFILPDNKKYIIIEETKNALRNKGMFVVFQSVTNNFKKHLKRYFSKISVNLVSLNIPPCFVYVCEK